MNFKWIGFLMDWIKAKVDWIKKIRFFVYPLFEKEFILVEKNFKIKDNCS